MVKVVIKNNHLNFGGVRYFRSHAEEVQIGDYGEKKTSLTSANFLDVKDRIPVPKIDAVTSTIVDIDINQLSQTDLNTGISAIVKGVPVRFSGDAAFKKLKEQELKLVKFSVLSNTIKDAANKSPKVLEDLRRYGKDACIAHQVFVVMEASLATKFDNNVSAKLSVGIKGLEATVEGNHASSGTSIIQLSAGTGFAYLLLKLDWDKKETEILDLDIDQWSFS